jgi:hypothetical protein
LNAQRGLGRQPPYRDLAKMEGGELIRLTTDAGPGTASVDHDAIVYRR